MVQWIFAAYCQAPARRVLQSCLEGLRFLHGQRVAHGAVRAGNLLLGPGAAIRLADFGLKALREGTAAALRHGPAASGLSQSAAPWMSPEVLEGSAPSALSDIWSVGCLTARELTALSCVPTSLWAQSSSRSCMDSRNSFSSARALPATRPFT